MVDIIAERRQVTVVYCDLVDSTGLHEREGVERYYDVQAAFFRVCAWSSPSAWRPSECGIPVMVALSRLVGSPPTRTTLNAPFDSHLC